MRQRFLIGGLVFLLTLGIGAQTEPSKTPRVIWASDENCHGANSQEVKADSPKCSLINVDDRDFRIMSFRGISVAIDSKYILVGKRNYVRSTIQVTNSSGAAIQVDPTTWLIYRYENESDLLNAVGIPTVIKTTRASNVKLRRKVTTTPTSGVSVATQPITREEALKPPGQLSAADRAKMQEVGPASGTPRATASSVTITSVPSQAVRENELVKKRVEVGAKTAGYIFFMDVPQNGHVVTVIRLNNVDMIFPI